MITVHDAGNDPRTKIVIRTLCVQETLTTVTVLWQDGSRETLSSTEFIPYLNVDEHDCWYVTLASQRLEFIVSNRPGDHVLWKSEDQSRVAVVQSVNATDRVAIIRCLDTGAVETVSVLELDPNGAGGLGGDILHSYGFGVRRGDSVFVHAQGTTNGFEPPRVPKIGEIEEWVREPPVLSDGELGGWRRVMAKLGAELAAEHGVHGLPLHNVNLPEDESLLWFGEVIEVWFVN